jgi:phosphoribosyl 1,2-cyclic phosphodiesterase
MSLDGRRPKRVDLLITHLHTDHIEGLRFFGPFWDPDVEFRIWGPPAPTKNLEQRLAPFFSPPFFPVHMRNVPSRPTFREVPEEPWTIGSMTVSASLVKHPGPRSDTGSKTAAMRSPICRTTSPASAPTSRRSRTDGSPDSGSRATPTC